MMANMNVCALTLCKNTASSYTLLFGRLCGPAQPSDIRKIGLLLQNWKK